MYSLILFILVCLAQYMFFLWKRSDIREYQEIGSDVANLTGVDKHHVYKKSIRIVGNILNNFKTLLIIPIIILLILNLILSVIIGTGIHLIVGLF